MAGRELNLKRGQNAFDSDLIPTWILSWVGILVVGQRLGLGDILERRVSDLRRPARLYDGVDQVASGIVDRYLAIDLHINVAHGLTGRSYRNRHCFLQISELKTEHCPEVFQLLPRNQIESRSERDSLNEIAFLGDNFNPDICTANLCVVIRSSRRHGAAITKQHSCRPFMPISLSPVQTPLVISLYLRNSAVPLQCDDLRSNPESEEVGAMAIYECVVRFDTAALLDVLNYPDEDHRSLLVSKKLVGIIVD